MTTGIDGIDIYNNICDIRTGHEYSLLSAFEMIDINNRTHKVLMIRDSHGTTDYNCTWNMNDTNWTEDLIKQGPFGKDLRKVQMKGGIFIVPIHEYI